MGDSNRTVCVTGGSGYIGSMIVRLLLQRGYIVHATVKDLSDENETNHLRNLEYANSHLHLFQIDLSDYASITNAVRNTGGIFHLASPCILERLKDPQRGLVIPAVEGTKNVLAAAKANGVKRVVLTSSTAAIFPDPALPEDKVKGEDCWTDIEYCKQKELWYPVSKALAEKAAWKFASESGLDLVVVNPGFVLGPILPPILNASMLMLLRLLQGCTIDYEDIFMGIVHIEDAALAHILVYETRSASGRYLCVESVSYFSDFASKVAELCPDHVIPMFQDTQRGLLRASSPSKKLMDLGVNFKPMEEVIIDGVDALKAGGFIK